MLGHLKANNRACAERMVAADANFFRRLERQQSQEYLWIGCSDSRDKSLNRCSCIPSVSGHLYDRQSPFRLLNRFGRDRH
jgi:hypothetical protein